MLLSAALLLQASSAAASAETAPISETDSFFVCVGTYGAEEIPLLQYFQPSSSSSGSRYKLRMYCFAGMDSAPAYGDIFIAEGGSFKTVPNNVPITRDKS